jgi:hypothetical protein
MGEIGSTFGGMRCMAVFVEAGCSSSLPALIVDVAAGDRQHADAMISRLVGAGLARVTSASELQAHAAGWMVLSRRGVDRVDVLMRASGRLRVFVAGDCVLRDDWLESVARTGYCLLLAGQISPSGIPDAVPDPELATRMIGAAGAAGLLAGALVPVYLPGYDSDRKDKTWPGTVRYRRRPGESARPLGASITLDMRAELGAAADLVRAEANGMGPAWVRQRLAVEFMLSEQIMPPTIVDRIAEDITSDGPVGRARNVLRAFKTGLATIWLLGATIVAFALGRPLPHWHILGMHVINTSQHGPGLEVSVDPSAGELVAVGEPDDIDVWLGLSREFSSGDGEDDIVVYRGDYRLGVLKDIDGDYRAILTEPRHARTILMTDATRSRTADGSWDLRLHSPA